MASSKMAHLRWLTDGASELLRKSHCVEALQPKAAGAPLHWGHVRIFWTARVVRQKHFVQPDRGNNWYFERLIERCVPDANPEIRK